MTGTRSLERDGLGGPAQDALRVRPWHQRSLVSRYWAVLTGSRPRPADFSTWPAAAGLPQRTQRAAKHRKLR